MRPLSQYVARSRDAEVLLASTSGGAFSAFASVIIQEGGVVVAAGWDGTMGRAQHKVVEDLAGVSSLRGTKYMVSDLSLVWGQMREMLARRRKVLFVGTPCQVAAVKKMFKQSDDLYACAIVCHSNMPSDVWLKYRTEKEATMGSSLVDVRFRDKGFGWREGVTSLCFEGPVRYLHETVDENLYMRIFYSGYGSQRLCFSCPFRGGRSGADLTFGDFWGIEEVEPSLDDGKGVNVVLVHTGRGEALLARAPLEKRPVTYEQAVKENPYIEVSPQVDAIKRERFQRVYKRMSLRKSLRYAEYGPWYCEMWIRPYRMIRHVCGVVFRTLKQGAR